jgi:hypothetical protein
MTQAIRSTANLTSEFNRKSEPVGDKGPAGLNGGYRAGVIAGVLMLMLILGILYSAKHRAHPAAESHAIQPLLVPSAVAPIPSAVKPSVPVAKKRARSASSTVRYLNSDYGVSFRYARNDELLSGEKVQPGEDGIGPVHLNFSEPGGEALASVQLSAPSHSGTDFRSASFNVSVHTRLTSDKCNEFATSSEELSQGGVLSSAGAKIGALGLEGTTDNAWGNSKYYHVFRDGTCYEFQLTRATVSGDAGAARMPVNQGEGFGKLDKILASVTIQRPKSEPAE